MGVKYFDKVNLSNVLIVRMKPKEELRAKLEEVMVENNFKRAVILSAIGSVYDATFHGVKPGSDLPYNPDQITTVKKTGPFEVLTMEGNILPAGNRLIPHLHVTLGAHDGTVVGGHLDRATVYTTIELFLAEIKGSQVMKIDDEVAGGTQIKLPIGAQ